MGPLNALAAHSPRRLGDELRPLHPRAAQQRPPLARKCLAGQRLWDDNQKVAPTLVLPKCPEEHFVNKDYHPVNCLKSLRRAWTRFDCAGSMTRMTFPPFKMRMRYGWCKRPVSSVHATSSARSS